YLLPRREPFPMSRLRGKDTVLEMPLPFGRGGKSVGLPDSSNHMLYAGDPMSPASANAYGGPRAGSSATVKPNPKAPGLLTVWATTMGRTLGSILTPPTLTVSNTGEPVSRSSSSSGLVLKVELSEV